MQAKQASLGASVFRFLLAGGGLYFAFWLARLEGWELIGLILMGLMCLVFIQHSLLFSGAGRQAARQIRLASESRKVSGAFGKSRLARTGDAAIRRLRGPNGFFLGLLGKTSLFYDPFARGNAHMLTYAPSRTGKTVSVVIPALLHWAQGSLFVTDVKGELAAITARLRAKRFGQKVLILNPFKVLNIPGVCFNPLRILVTDVMRNGGQNLHELVNLIALQLLPEPRESRGDDSFFRNGGRRLLIALLLFLAVFMPKECHLPKLRQLVWSSDEEKIDIAARLVATPWFGGLLQEYGNALADMLNPQYVRTYGAFRDYALEAVRIYDGHSSFGQSLMQSDFALTDLLTGKVTVYCILPEAKLETHGVWVGLIATLLFETIAAAGKPSPVLCLLEEMGNLGRLPNVSKALSLLPGKGCRCWMIFQSRRQPVQIYGQHLAGIIEEQSSMIQAWSIRSQTDRREWSERIGTRTKKARSLNRDSRDPVAPWRLSVSERGAPVMSGDEIARLGPDRQLIFIDGARVVCAEKLPYYRVSPWRRMAARNPYHPGAYPQSVKLHLNFKR